MSDTDDYDVGYKKPPVETRFGGPKANPRHRGGRSSRNLKTDLADELARRIPVKSDGKPVRMSAQRALLRSLVVEGIKGNTRATSKVFDLVLRTIGAEEKDETIPEELSEQDQAILDGFLKRQAGGDAGS